MEQLGRSYSRHFSAFLVDDENQPPMPSQPVHQPRPTRSLVGAPPTLARHTSSGQRRARPPMDDDIPVLESGGFTGNSGLYSDGEDDDDGDDDEEEEEEDGDDDDDDGVDEGLENVPVLQTAEDAEAVLGKRPKKTSKRKQAIRKLRDVATVTTRRSAEKGHDVPPNNGAVGESPVVFDRKSTHSSLTSTNSMSSMANAGAFGRSSMSGGSSTTNRVMVRSGWLVRQGQHLKTWKRRYFVLIKRTNHVTGEISASLQYYKGSNFGKLRGEIHLNDGGPLTIRFVDVSESKKPFCFGISRGEFSLFCQGKDDEDVSAWVWHLQSLAAQTATEGSGSERSGILGSNSRGTVAGLGSVASLGNRGIFITAELRRLLHNSKSPEAAKCKNFIKNFECQSASSLRQMRDLHASVTESIMRIHGARIIAMTEEKAQLEQQSGYGNTGQALTISDLQVITSRHVEDVIFSPLQESVFTFLRRAFGEDDAVLNRKLRWLQGKDQTYYNIPLHQVSWKDWRKASKMLSQLALVASPTAKYEILVATMKEIQLTYAEEHDQVLESENPLETDDLIPIFTYVLANSGVDNLLALKLLLSELNGAWAVGGSLDNGAALSVLNYAIDFIGTVSIPAVLEDIFRDQITLSIDGEWRQVLELEVEPTYRYGAVVRQISPQNQNTIGSSIARGHVLVTVNGQNVVLWPYTNIAALLKESTPPHRLAFIPSNSYFKILTSNKALWNVALAHACQRGDIASVQMLLANGADVNYVAHESGGNTPLHIAVSALHFNVVSYLLQHGAKAKTLGEYGRSALHMVGSPCTLPASSAATSTSTVVGNSLKQNASKFQPTDKIVMIIKKLLNHGTPFESTDIYGYTPVMLLARKGLVNGIDVLVEHSGGDLDLDARNWQHGMSALALAAREGHLNVVEALLDYGVQSDISDLNGDTPLHFAAAIAAKDVCRVLIQRDCDVDVRNRDGVTPLMVAAARTTVLDDTDAKTIKNRERAAQALRSRVETLYVFETIEYLIEARADLYAVCSLYRLPLHFAAMYGGQEVYQFLGSKMKMDIDSQVRDLFGMTAEALAIGKKESPPSEDGSDSGGAEDTHSRDSQGEPQSDFQLLVNASHRPSEKVERKEDLVVEVIEDDRVVVAGTLAAICDELYRFDAYQIEDVAALISTCTVSSYRVLIDYMREALRRTADKSVEGMYVRRMVLHSVDLMVQSFMQKVELDTEVCSCIHEFCTELFPFKLEDDPACGQWLASSFLPMFSEAVRTGRLFDLRVTSPCDTAYSSLKTYLKGAKKTSPTLKFLDDDQFASTFGVEVITESMRRRLSIAGVWQGEGNKSFIVRSESTESPSIALNRKTLQLPRGRSVGNDRITRVWLLDVDVSILADQITLFQHYLFSQIRVSEMLESKRSAEKTPAYDRLRQFHNHISVWVVNQILSRDDVDQRVQVLSHFIKVAGVCLQPLQNFDGFMAIMNATNDSSVFRLKKTWNRLSPQVREQWHELKKFTESGARSLHKLMRDAMPPMIPYLGVVMQSIIAVQEYPDRTEGDLINFKKIRLLGGVVKRFSSMQSSPYLLPIDRRVLDQVCSPLQYPDPETCFNRSLKIEPRIPTS